VEKNIASDRNLLSSRSLNSFMLQSPIQENSLQPNFLKGGGEMGKLISNYEWSNSKMGPIESWPQNLQTTLNIILPSRFPMYIFWGPDHLCFYNDAYRTILGENGKHPSALGRPAREVWEEIWPVIHPLIRQVLDGGESIWSEDQLLPIYRNGRIEDVYWTFSYSAITDGAGRPEGVFVTCAENTKTVTLVQELKTSEQRFRNLIGEATTGIIVLSGEEMKIDTVNDAYAKLIGRTTQELIGRKLFDVNPESEEHFRPMLNRVLATGEPLYLYHYPYYVFEPSGSKKEGWLNITYQPHTEANGKISGIMALHHDVTRVVEAKKDLEESASRLRSLVESAPFPIGVYVGEDLIIELANKAITDAWGKGDDVIGKPYREVLPELHNQEIFEQLEGVLRTGKPFHSENKRVDIFANGNSRPFYFNYSFTPVRDSSGKVYGVMNTGADVTALNIAKQEAEENRNNLHNTVMQAPVAMCLFKGPEHVVELANDRMLMLWGKDAQNIVGKPVFEGLHEAKDQGFEVLLNNVFNTGETYTALEVAIKLPRNGRIEKVYIDFVYAAFRENNVIKGVMAVATEVTTQVNARKEIEAAQQRAELAIESADLGTYEIDIKADKIITSARLDEIWGLSGTTSRSEYVKLFHPDDVAIRDQAIAESAITSHLHYEIRLIQKDGSIHWIRTKGKMLYDADNKPKTLLGITQDITAEKQFTEALTRQVNERTAELKRSNEDLLHFAHVASHDLKEPVRKIRIFSNMIDEEFGALLPDIGRNYLGKVHKATDRMFSMIEGVLSYSALNSSEQPIAQIDLNSVVDDIKNDLEVMIHLKKASMEAGLLPVIEGAPILIYQLFYNLVNNALKFSKEHEPLLLKISSAQERLGGRNFVRVMVADNGIGIEQEYAEQIFNPFTRLNAKDLYEGTGLGLALCKKIVERHHGSISATGIKNQGTIFTVLLPLRQFHQIV
jgi:hypothetical protein